MKKIGYILISVLIFVLAGKSDAIVNNRYTWWEHTYKNLNREKVKIITEGDYDPSLYSLIENDIKDAEEILKIFERKIVNSSELNYLQKQFSKEEIQNITKKNCSPVFYTFYLDHAVNNINSRNTLMRSDQLIYNNLSKLIPDIFSSPNEGLLNLIMNNEVKINDKKFIAMEALLLSMKKVDEEVFTGLYDNVLSDIQAELTKINFTTTEKALEDLILQKTMLHLNATDLKETAIDTDSIDTSWCWRENKSKIKNKLTFYNDILIMLNSDLTEITAPELNALYRNPDKLEIRLFNMLSENYLDARKLIDHTQTPSYPDKAYVMNIPGLPDIKKLYSDIDSIRKDHFNRINGKEEDPYFNALRGQFKNIISKYFASTDKAFKDEEDELQSRRQKSDYNNYESLLNKLFSLIDLFQFSNPNIEPANEDEFLQAKDIFRSRQMLAYEYSERSVEFLKWTSNLKKDNHRLSTGEYRYRLEKNREYMDFLLSMVERCEGISSTNSTDLKKRFSVSIQRSSGVLKAIGNSFSIYTGEKSSLSFDEIKEIKKVKQDAETSIKNTAASIKDIFERMVREFRRVEMILAEREKSLLNRIAEFEMELFYNKVNNYLKAYEELTYSKNVFKEYSKIYRETEKNVNNYKLSNDLQKVFDQNSVFPLLKKFDKKRLVREYETKRHLKIQMQRDIARIRSLSEFYRRNGVLLNNLPDNDEIKSIRQRLSEKPEVRIACWKMNEMNFSEIDSNAVKRLGFIRKRVVWKYNAQENSGYSVTLSNPKINLTMPEGWVELQPQSTDLQKGIIRMFRSLDGKSSIYIASLSKNGLDKKEISEYWIDKTGRMKLKEKWGKKDDIEYFWTLSRNRKKRDIMELYTITLDNQILIISGISTRDKYNYFKDKLTSVFNSISI